MRLIQAIPRIMRLILTTVLLAVLLTVSSCSDTRYYVVRHAEKLNNTDNSPLSEAGFRRSGVLAERLSSKDIRVIFVSDKQRTQQTAAPTAARFSLTPIIIPREETDRLITELKKISGKNILVVWHLPEVSEVVNALSPLDTIPPIPADEFDNLFVITERIFLWDRRIWLERSKY